MNILLPRPVISYGEELAIPLPDHWRVTNSQDTRGRLVPLESSEGELISHLAGVILDSFELEVTTALLTPRNQRDIGQIQLALLYQ